MIVDTSAVIAILHDEIDKPRYTGAIEADEHPKMSVVNYVEAGVVVDAARNPSLSRKLDDFVR